MNQLLSVKDLFGTKATAKENYCELDKCLKRPDSNDKESDFGKILKQRDSREKPAKSSEKFSQSDKESESQEDVSECREEDSYEKPAQEVPEEESEIENVFLAPQESVQRIEDDRWTVGTDVLSEVQQPEDFSKDEVLSLEDEPVKDLVDVLEQTHIPVSEMVTEQTPQPVKDAHEPVKVVAEDLPNAVTEKTDSLIVRPKIASVETENATNADVAIKEEIALPLETQNETVKANPNIKPVVVSPKNEVKISKTIQLPNVPLFESLQNTNNLLNLQHFEGWNNIGIKSAPKGSERKGGFVSSHSPISKEAEGPLHRDLAISSNGSRVAEVLSQKADVPFPNNSEQNFDNQVAILPTVQSKVAVNAYETVRQEHAETVQGMIATLEQQMDDLKRTRRNSVIVKVDLENGESLNCQVTLARSDVAIRFPALEESFKMQILNHWESLRKFAQTRQLNLIEPHFIAQTSL